MIACFDLPVCVRAVRMLQKMRNLFPEKVAALQDGKAQCLLRRFKRADNTGEGGAGAAGATDKIKRLLYFLDHLTATGQRQRVAAAFGYQVKTAVLLFE